MAPASRSPQALEEPERASLNVSAVVATHDWLDGLGGFIGVVEGDGADVVVEDMGFDDAVEESAANKAELAVNGCGGATDIVPASGRVVGERGIGVLEVCDRNWDLLDL